MNKYKTKYLHLKKLYYQLKQQTAGATFIDPTSKKQYTGAGVMLLEMHNGQPTVILFKTKRKNQTIYEDLGGTIDHDDLASYDPLKSTAIREAFEESRGLINISDPNHIKKYVDVPFYNKFFRSYPIGVQYDKLFVDYYYNKNVIDKHDHIVKTMKETYGIARFYIKDIINDDIAGHTPGSTFVTVDVNGKHKNIYTRTADILQAMISNNMVKSIIKNPIDFIQLKCIVSV
jgi:hypothetical protein